MRPLESVKVLDLTRYMAGPTCTEFLAFLGADVIKIEPPGMGEPARYQTATPEERAKNLDAWLFLFFNANKRAVTLNLKSEKGVAMFKEMIKQADATVSSFLSGTMDNLGIGYEVLRKINSKLVYAELSGFGKGGPYSSYPAYDPISKAIGSAYSNTGLASTPPLGPGPLFDGAAAIYMTGAILAAILSARQTGKGMSIDMSMSDAVVDMNRLTMAFNTMSDGTAKPAPRPDAPEVFKCKGDGPNDYVLIMQVTPGDYTTLMKTVGREDMITSELGDNMMARQANFPKIKEAVEAWTRTMDKMEVFRTLAPLGILTAPVLDTVEVLDDPHFKQRGMVVEMDHPLRGKFRMPGCPVQISGYLVDYKPSPLLGQHNKEVYADWLGLSKDDLEKLKNEKVI